MKFNYDDDNNNSNKEGKTTNKETQLGGVKTNLCRKNSNTQAKSSDNPRVRSFLDEVETILLDIIDKYKPDCTSEKQQSILHLQLQLKNNPIHAVDPTDKTNSFRVIQTIKFKTWVLEHLENWLKKLRSTI